MPLPPILGSVTPSSILGRARAWPVESQQGSRRNAMIACTALAARRAEREDVEAFLDAAEDRRQPVAAPAAHG